jgi:hypothetical protein
MRGHTDRQVELLIIIMRLKGSQDFSNLGKTKKQLEFDIISNIQDHKPAARLGFVLLVGQRTLREIFCN